MKKLICLLLFFMMLNFLSSCYNKTVHLLTKTWDCVQVDNIIPADIKIHSKKDSVDAAQLISMLKLISWTFKKNRAYACSVNGRITVAGKYELQEQDKIIQCTSEIKHTINNYKITTLTENELVLSGRAENTSLVLHFKSR